MDKKVAAKSLNENSARMIRDILQDVDANGVRRGVGEDIKAFDPMPSEDNNWLFDEESDSFSGVYIDGKNVRNTFKIMKSNGGWEVETNIEKVEDMDKSEMSEELITDTIEQPSDQPSEESDYVESTIDTEEVKFGEGCGCNKNKNKQVFEEKNMIKKEMMEKDMVNDSDEEMNEMMQELEMLRSELAKLKAEKAEAEFSSLSQYAKNYYSEGVLNPSKLSEENLVSILVHAYNLDNGLKVEKAVFSEGDKSFNLSGAIKQILEAISTPAEPQPIAINTTPITVANSAQATATFSEFKIDPNLTQNELVTNYCEHYGLDKTNVSNLHKAYTAIRILRTEA